MAWRGASLQSDVAVPAVVNGGNGMTGIGAIWDFGSLVKGSELKPGELSEGQDLQFRLADIRPLKQRVRPMFGLANLEAKVLARLAKAPTTTD